MRKDLGVLKTQRCDWAATATVSESHPGVVIYNAIDLRCFKGARWIYIHTYKCIRSWSSFRLKFSKQASMADLKYTKTIVKTGLAPMEI